MAKLSIDKTLSQAKSLEKRGKITEAQKLYQDILQAFPKNRRARQSLMILNKKPLVVNTQNPPQEVIDQLISDFNSGRLSIVLTLATALTNQFPASFVIWNILGAAAAQIGNLDQAILAFQKVILLKPNYADAYNNLGNVLKDQAKYDFATEAYDKALSLHPNFAEALNNKGLVLQNQGKLREAIEAYNKALLLKSDYPNAYNNKGLALVEQGDMDEGIQAYTKALSLNPTLKNAASNFVNLPVGSLSKKNIRLCETFNSTLAKSLTDPSDIFFQAKLHKHKGELDQAFSKFCRANEIRLAQISPQFRELEQRSISRIEDIKKWIPRKKPLLESSITKIFLLGPSRSGKSTLESLLVRSPQVWPLYEAIKMERILTTDKLKFADIFFQDEKSLVNNECEVVTSTAPGTIFYSDRLMDILDNVYFIIMERDKRDVSAEIFTKEYNHENSYTCDPIELEKYLLLYYEVCQILRIKVPERCITITFQELTESPESVIERIGHLLSKTFKVEALEKTISTKASQSLFRNHYANYIANF